jgi:hypothetical protein
MTRPTQRSPLYLVAYSAGCDKHNTIPDNPNWERGGKMRC